jgi:hypothetical protein
MKNIKLKITSFNEKIINFFNKIPSFNKFKSSKLIKISRFNKILIFLIALLFLYLFYLSIPSLYDKGRVQKHLSDYILKEFNINLSLSSDIKYSILPSPHIVIKNAKIFSNDSSNVNEISQIKKLKIFISQKTLFKSLFDEKKIKINKILIENANFLVNADNLKYYNNFINNKLSEKKIKVLKSNFFYKNDKNETISIFYISEIKLYYLKEKLINQLLIKGETYKFPFNIKWNKDFKLGGKKITNFKVKKLGLEIKNISEIKEKKHFGDNVIYIKNIKLNTKYELDDNKLDFISKELKSKSEIPYYNGEILFNPFNLELDLTLPKISIKEILNIGNFFNEILKTNLLFNQNISTTININSEKITSKKIFDNFKLSLKINNGKIDFDNSFFVSKKIGSLTLKDSSIFIKKNQLIFNGSFNFQVNNQENFYKSFQISKKNRKPIKDIFFEIDMNFINNDLQVKNVRINEGDIITTDKFERFLSDMNNVDLSNKNWIYIKRFTNKIFQNYDG